MDKLWTINQIFEALQSAGITNSMQMTRKWVRQGTIPGGIMPKGNRNRKEGWRVPRESVEEFIKSKKPEVNELDQLHHRVETLEFELASLRRQCAQLSIINESHRKSRNRLTSLLDNISKQKRPVDEEYRTFIYDVLCDYAQNLNERHLEILFDLLLEQAPKVLNHPFPVNCTL